MAAVGTLAASVAHEINNPNGLILLNLAMFRQVYECAQEALQAQCERQGELWMDGIPWSSLREQMPQILDDTMQASRRINGIVEDLKDFAGGQRRLERGLRPQRRGAGLPPPAGEPDQEDPRPLAVDYASDLPLVHGSAKRSSRWCSTW